MSKKTAAEKMAMTEAMLDFDSMAKDIVNAKTQNKKFKAMDRLYKRLQSQGKLRDMIIEKATKKAKKAKKPKPMTPPIQPTRQTPPTGYKKKTGGKVKKMMGGGKVHMKKKKK